MNFLSLSIRISDGTGNIPYQYLDSAQNIVNYTPAIVSGVNNIMNFTFYDQSGNIIPLTDYTTWSCMFTLVDDWTQETPPIAIAGSVTAGEDNTLIVTLSAEDSSTEAILTALETKESISTGFEIKGYKAGSTAPDFIVQQDMIMRNQRVRDGAIPPEGDPVLYYTKTQVDSLLAAVQNIDGVMLPLDKVEYTDELGYYAELVNSGDSVKAVYNAYGVSSVQLLVKSANSAITGNVEVTVNGIPWQLTVGADYAWQRLDIPSTISGVITVELVTGLSDDGAAVGLLIGGMMVRDNVAPQYSGALQQYVSAKPLLYSDTQGYYCLLDDTYDIAFTQWVQNCTAIALRIVTANQAFTGNIYLNVTVGSTTKSFTVPVAQTLSWVLLPLDAAVSGQVTITRDSANSADTLKDGSSVVSAGVGSINYYYNI